MKKLYQKICMTPLDVSFEGNVLQASTVDTTVAMTKTTGQEIDEYPFQDDSFNTEWE